MNRIISVGTRLAIVLGGILLCGGCAQQAVRLQKARSAFWAGDLETADAYLDKLANERLVQPIVLADKGMISLLRGDVEDAEQRWLQVRDSFEHLEQISWGEEGVSLLTDDRRRAYAGETYERILIRDFLAIANLMGDADDAVAYCLQAIQKQEQIRQRNGDLFRDPATRVCLADYLYGVLREETHVHYDDARRAYARVFQNYPMFTTAAADLHRVRTASHSRPQHGTLYLIGLVGPGPSKQETVAPVTSQALAIAAQILNSQTEHPTPALSAPVRIPEIVLAESRVDGIHIAVDGKAAGETQTITDVGQLAVTMDRLNRTQTIARAVVRRTTKKASIYQAKKAIAGNSVSSFVLDVGEYIWEETEAADLRCWSTLPRTIQICRLELPVGIHAISLSPTRSGSFVGPVHTTQVAISDGRNSYVVACFPTEQLSGNVVVSRRATVAESNRRE